MLLNRVPSALLKFPQGRGLTLGGKEPGRGSALIRQGALKVPPTLVDGEW